MYRNFVLLACVLALGVVMLGAFVRLSDAGLGCPDWPGCYGKLVVPAQDVAQQHEGFAARPLEAPKAWKEMAHRYLASVLGLLIVVIAGWSWRLRQRDFRQPVWVSSLLVVVVVLQGMLGMWTVTLLLKPLIVVGHLLGGFGTLALLWLLHLQLAEPAAITRHSETPSAMVSAFAKLAMVVVVMQIFLGGWTSTNYAALACTDFPTCQGTFAPKLDVANAFTLWHGLGINYEYGILDSAARVTIHWAHRLGALVTFVVVGAIAIVITLHARASRVRYAAIAVGAILLTQLALGITNVVASLPLAVAVAHNGMAALLLLSTLTLVWFTRHQS